MLRSVVAEFAGTLALVLIGCGSCAGGDQGEAAIDDQANTVRQIIFYFHPILSLSKLRVRQIIFPSIQFLELHNLCTRQVI